MPDHAPDAAPDGAPMQITDPLALRALAHPARVAIGQHLALEGPATATQCAGVTGLSPSACSYHLRILAKYGFVEPDPASAADGRNRPWRARVTQLNIPGDPGQSAATQLVARLLGEQMYARSSARRAQYLDQAARYSPSWQAADELSELAVHVTPDELARLQSELRDLLAKYLRLDPAGRPAGARRCSMLLDLVPWFPPDADAPSAGGSR